MVNATTLCKSVSLTNISKKQLFQALLYLKNKF